MLPHYNRMINILAGRTDNAPPLPLIETFYCNVARRSFSTEHFQTMPHPDLTQRWASCPYCDQHMRLVGQPGYDASIPQPHAVGYDDRGHKVVSDE